MHAPHTETRFQAFPGLHPDVSRQTLQKALVVSFLPSISVVVTTLSFQHVKWSQIFMSNFGVSNEHHDVFSRERVQKENIEKVTSRR